MVFGLKNEDKYTPREQSIRITRGIVPPHHIGKKTVEVMKQLLISHIQNYQETFSNAEKKMWTAEFDVLKREIV